MESRSFLLTSLCCAAFSCGGIFGGLLSGEPPKPLHATEPDKNGGEGADSEPGPFDDSTITLKFADGLLRRKLYSEAESQYTLFLSKYSDDKRIGLAYLWRGEARYRLGKYQLAAKDFHAFITKYNIKEKEDFARLRYGCCLFEMGHHQKAVATLQPLSGKETDDPGVRQSANFYLGLSYHELRNFPQALKALDKIETGPMLPDATFAKGEILSSKGKHAEAADMFGIFAKKFKGNSRLNFAIHRQGEEFRAAGKLQSAAACFQSIILKGKDDPLSVLNAQCGLAWVRYAQGDFAATIALTRKVVESGDLRLRNDSLYLMGLAALQAKQYSDAEKAFSQVVGGVYQQDAMRKQAWAFLSSGNTSGALKTVDDYTKKFPKANRDEMEYIAGKVYGKLGKWDEAILHLVGARKSTSDYHEEASFDLAHAYSNMGEVYAAAGDQKKSNEQFKLSADAYQYFIKSFPQSRRLDDALIGRGRVLMLCRNYTEALPVYARLLASRMASETVKEQSLNQQAVAYFHLKQFENMRKCYERLIKEYPKGKSVPEALYWLAWYDSSERSFLSASRRYDIITRDFPEHKLAPKAWYYLFSSLYRAGKQDRAADTLFTIISKHPEVPVNQKEIIWLGQYLMNKDELDKAYRVYENLLSNSPGRKVRAVALYYQAEVKRQRGEWKEAKNKYDQLLAEKDTGLEPAGYYGLAVCQRELGNIAEARKTIDNVKLDPRDPLAAFYHKERGMLDLAEKKYAQAARHLMHVGLLYDDEKLCGEALVKATEACLAAGDKEKALICLKELAGDTPDTYGQRYPKSKFTLQGRKMLQDLLRSSANKDPELK